ncbi:MAG: arsenate reductase (azurin) small subunit [Myxococcota bacterium]
MQPSRRAVLGGGTALAAFLASSTASAVAPRTRLAALSDLKVGEPRVLAYPTPDHPVVLVKLGRAAKGGVGEARDIVCFSMLCTHQGCPVTFADGRFLCPCHYSQFDPAVAGQCYQGPAYENLPQIRLQLEGEDVFAVGIEGLIWGRVENPA